MFEGLAPETGIQSILTAGEVLGRIDALATGTDPARAQMRDADKAAVDLLAKRGSNFSKSRGAHGGGGCDRGVPVLNNSWQPDAW